MLVLTGACILQESLVRIYEIFKAPEETQENKQLISYSFYNVISL